MKENQHHPEDPKISALLRNSRAKPSLPPHFQQKVWRRIEDAEASLTPASWLDALAGLVLRPRFACVAAAVLILAGVFLGAMEGAQNARQDAQDHYVALVAPHLVR